MVEPGSWRKRKLVRCCPVLAERLVALVVPQQQVLVVQLLRPQALVVRRQRVLVPPAQALQWAQVLLQRAQALASVVLPRQRRVDWRWQAVAAVRRHRPPRLLVRPPSAP